jgi:hypothetical protein
VEELIIGGENADWPVENSPSREGFATDN